MTDTSPAAILAARLALGQQLAGLRRAAGFTQHQFAPLLHYERSSVANVERGRQHVGRAWWRACDEILETGGLLVAGYERIEAMSRAAAITRTLDPSRSLLERRSSGPTDVRRSESWWAPSGRYFPGLTIGADIHPAIDDGRILAAVPEGYGADPFLRQGRHTLVVAQVDGPGGASLFGLDSRRAHRRLRAASPASRLLVPRSYLLDELTLAVVWAVANFDEALLTDDALIEESRAALAAYAAMPTSAVSRDLAAELHPVSHMWLGSSFCADHINRHVGDLDEVPMFWTREQRGEEASAWLLFTHKNEYLRDLAARYTAPTTRAFCVPRSMVDASPLAERILLLLAVALMESYGITVVVTDEGEYAGSPGFVTAGRRAIVATWIGADGIWHVDVTDRRATLHEFRDTARHAVAHSVIAAGRAAGRLAALAEYLSIDWTWLRQRSAECAEQGLADLARPRSRHLSTAGVDRACRFIGTLDSRSS